MSDNNIQPNVYSKEFLEGKEAFLTGKSNDENPYPSRPGGLSQQRYDFYMGYYSEKLKKYQ
jgi:hypothetical protein